MTDIDTKANVILQEAAARQWTTWAQNRPEFSAVMQVAGRLRALATILERSGVLTQFVAPAGRLPNAE